MSELASLHQRIAALTSDPVGMRTRDRTLAFEGTKEALDALLLEIRETRFQRFLTFQNNRLEQLTLLVHSGRVIEISNPTSETLLANCPELKDQPLADADQGGRRHFGKLIEGFLSGIEQLTVRPIPPPADRGNANIGLTLGRAFFDDLVEENFSSSNAKSINLQDYVSQILSISTAYVRLDGDQISHSEGRSPYLERLIQLANEEASTRMDNNPDKAEQEHFVLMRTRDESGQAALCAAIGNSVLFVTFPVGSTQEILSLWSDCRTS